MRERASAERDSAITYSDKPYAYTIPPEAAWLQCERPTLDQPVELAGGFLVRGNCWAIYLVIEGGGVGGLGSLGDVDGARPMLYRHHFKAAGQGQVVDVRWERYEP